MIYPAINDIMKAKNITSKYTLVVATAKRAREINQSKVTFTECKSDKAVTVALHEIYENKVNFKTAEKPKISEDESKDYEDQVQKLTDKYVDKVDSAIENKSKEIMTV